MLQILYKVKMDFKQIKTDIVNKIKESRDTDIQKFRFLQKLYAEKINNISELEEYLKTYKHHEYAKELLEEYIGPQVDREKEFLNNIKKIKVNNLNLSKTINFYIKEYPSLDEEYIREKIKEKRDEKTK